MLKTNEVLQKYDELNSKDLDECQGGAAAFAVIAGVGAAMYGAGYAIGKATYYLTH